MQLGVELPQAHRFGLVALLQLLARVLVNLNRRRRRMIERLLTRAFRFRHSARLLDIGERRERLEILLPIPWAGFAAAFTNSYASSRRFALSAYCAAATQFCQLNPGEFRSSLRIS